MNHSTSMKHRYWIPALLVIGGIALGFALGRVTGEPGESRTGKTDRTAGPSGKSAGHPDSGANGRGRGRGRDGNAGRSPAAAIRQVARKLELSPMVGMDYDTLFDAYESIRWMSPEEVRLALDELEDATSSTQVRMALQMMLISRWAKQDGRGAVEYAKEIKNPMQKMTAMMGGVMGWAKTDPENAYTWYQENRDELKGGMMGKGMMNGIFFASMAQQDMKKAFTRLKDLNKSEQKTAIVMMSHGATMDVGKRKEFLAELEQIEDEEVRRGGMQGLVAQWVMQDPEGAVEFVESRDWEDGAGEEVRQDLASTWAHLDPEAALDWRLKSAADQENRSEAVASQFSRWMGQDPDAASEWLRKQPEDLRTDALYGETAEQLRRNNDYEQSVQWADQIENQDTRNEKLGRIYRDWKKDDEVKAQEWFDRLDASVRDEVEKGPAEHPHEPVAPSDVEVVTEPTE